MPLRHSKQISSSFSSGLPLISKSVVARMLYLYTRSLRPATKVLWAEGVISTAEGKPSQRLASSSHLPSYLPRYLVDTNASNPPPSERENSILQPIYLLSWLLPPPASKHPTNLPPNPPVPLLPAPQNERVQCSPLRILRDDIDLFVSLVLVQRMNHIVWPRLLWFLGGVLRGGASWGMGFDDGVSTWFDSFIHSFHSRVPDFDFETPLSFFLSFFSFLSFSFPPPPSRFPPHLHLHLPSLFFLSFIPYFLSSLFPSLIFFFLHFLTRLDSTLSSTSRLFSCLFFSFGTRLNRIEQSWAEQSRAKTLLRLIKKNEFFDKRLTLALPDSNIQSTPISVHFAASPIRPPISIPSPIPIRNPSFEPGTWHRIRRCVLPPPLPPSLIHRIHRSSDAENKNVRAWKKRKRWKPSRAETWRERWNVMLKRGGIYPGWLGRWVVRVIDLDGRGGSFYDGNILITWWRKEWRAQRHDKRSH